MPETLVERRACLPATWLADVDCAAAVRIQTGMSGAQVWRIASGRHKRERYLKIAEGEAGQALRREIERTAWLAARNVRVPEILCTHDGVGIVALLTGAVAGMPADQAVLAPSALVAALGRALAGFHGLPAANCPFNETARVRLERARHLIVQGRIEASEFADRNRRLSPGTLLQRLANRIPAEELVVAHGDATLSNMIIDTDGTVGFVDCGHCGRADRYLDLAVAAQDIGERFGATEAKAFARAYGETDWDTAKAGFFADLYELF